MNATLTVFAGERLDIHLRWAGKAMRSVEIVAYAGAGRLILGIGHHRLVLDDDGEIHHNVAANQARPAKRKARRR